MKKIIILGASGGCLEIIDIIEHINAKKKKYKIIGLLDDNIKKNTNFPNYELLGNFNDVKKYKNKKNIFFVTGIGSDKNFFKKEKIIKKLNINKKKFITLIHPTSIISKNIVIGDGNIIHNNVSIGRNVVIEDHCNILPKVTIGHDSKIDSLNIINASVTIAGNTHIKKNCYIGTGALIRDHIKIEEKVLIGMGSVITKDINTKKIIILNKRKVHKKLI